ncbi:MAG: VWA domain-containing protein [Chloroflexi bacterium]|nr:VWA domain-containing protein [Chloroflexota bacterium]
MLGAAALLISLARPQAVIRVPREQAALILAIDVSGSMAVNDMVPTRMDAAKQAAHQFINGLPEDLQVGLVYFKEYASVKTPLTRDHDLVRRGVNQLEARGGTAIGEAIHTALDQLALYDQEEVGLIVLLSDGESNQGRPPIDAAKRAKEIGVPIYSVGIGQRGVTMRIGNQDIHLDEATLQAIAETTGGQYFYAAESKELAKIYTDLSSRVAWVEEYSEVTVIASALGMVLFLAGGLLSLRWFQQIP